VRVNNPGRCFRVDKADEIAIRQDGRMPTYRRATRRFGSWAILVLIPLLNVEHGPQGLGEGKRIQMSLSRIRVSKMLEPSCWV